MIAGLMDVKIWVIISLFGWIVAILYQVYKDRLELEEKKRTINNIRSDISSIILAQNDIKLASTENLSALEALRTVERKISEYKNDLNCQFLPNMSRGTARKRAEISEHFARLHESSSSIGGAEPPFWQDIPDNLVTYQGLTFHQSYPASEQHYVNALLQGYQQAVQRVHAYQANLARLIGERERQLLALAQQGVHGKT